MNVAVLISTYNGEKYISKQLDSLLKQNYKNLKIYIRDDGSSDNTLKIIDKYMQKNKNIILYKGENLGYCASFMKLLLDCPKSDYYAFCDQDDYWCENKIERAVEQLSEVGDIPSLYYSEVNVVDENLELIYKTLYTGVDTVGSSYNTAPVIGCTCVINDKLRSYFKKYGVPDNCVSHELFLYRFCLMINGKVVHDKESYILYRQHGNNVVGITNSPLKKIKAYEKYAKTRNYMAKSYIEKYASIIPEENYKIIKNVAEFYKHNILNKFRLIFSKKYKSQKFKSDLKFIYDVIFNKI